MRSTLYVWEALTAGTDDEWYTIAVMVPGTKIDLMPLVLRDLGKALDVTDLALAHAGGLGEKVRLATYEFTDVHMGEGADD